MGQVHGSVVARRVAARVGLAVIAVGVVSACGSSSSTPAQKSKQAGSTTTTVAAGSGNVDLTVSGSVSLVLKGTKVTCGTDAGRPQVRLAGADYPPLGLGELTVRQPSSAAGSASLAVALESGVYFTRDPQPASAVIVSGKKWTISALSARNSSEEEILVSGTVVCP